MNLKTISLLMLLFLLNAPLLPAQGTGTTAKTPKVEVYYFHPTERCPIDLTIEDNTRKLMRAKFAEQIKSGVIKFQVLNIDDKLNDKVASRFEINAQALYVVRHDETGEKKTDLTEFAFSKSQSSPEQFKAELEEQVKKALK